jgi:hypothetical protein
MTLELQLSDHEARLLATHLNRHLERLDAELVHTDQRAMHRALAAEIDELRAVAARLGSAVAVAQVARSA